MSAGAWIVIAECGGSAQKPYRISYNNTQFGCSCPAWTRGKNAQEGRKDCKHIGYVTGVLNGKKDSDVKLLPEGDKLKKVMEAAILAVS